MLTLNQFFQTVTAFSLVTHPEGSSYTWKVQSPDMPMNELLSKRMKEITQTPPRGCLWSYRESAVERAGGEAYLGKIQATFYTPERGLHAYSIAAKTPVTMCGSAKGKFNEALQTRRELSAMGVPTPTLYLADKNELTFYEEFIDLKSTADAHVKTFDASRLKEIARIAAVLDIQGRRAAHFLNDIFVPKDAKKPLLYGDFGADIGQRGEGKGEALKQLREMFSSQPEKLTVLQSEYQQSKDMQETCINQLRSGLKAFS